MIFHNQMFYALCCKKSLFIQKQTILFYLGSVDHNPSMYLICLQCMYVIYFSLKNIKLLMLFLTNMFLHVFRLFYCMLQFVCFCLSQANNEETNNYKKEYVPFDCGIVVPSVVTFLSNAFYALGVRLCFR